MENNNRFAFVDFFRKKNGGPDPDDFGFIYCDQETGKEYLVPHIYVKSLGKPHYTLLEVSEIVRRPPDNTYLTEQEFSQKVVLSKKPTQAIEDLVSQLRAESASDGEIFKDAREHKLEQRQLPRFEPTEHYWQIGEKDEDEDCGYFYCDNKSGKEYLVMESYIDKGGIYAVRSIEEVLFRTRKTIMGSVYTYRYQLKLKDADIDVQNDLVDHLSTLCKNSGGKFEDRRVRKTLPPVPSDNTPKPR